MGLEPNTYHPVGQPIATQLMGVAVAKDATGLQQAIAEALTALMADGTYRRLLDKWKLSANAIERVTINVGE